MNAAKFEQLIVRMPGSLREELRACAEREDRSIAQVVRSAIHQYLGRGVVHQCPLGDGGVMPCCGRTPFDLPAHERMTLEPRLVTCVADRGEHPQ